METRNTGMFIRDPPLRTDVAATAGIVLALLLAGVAVSLQRDAPRGARAISDLRFVSGSDISETEWAEALAASVWQHFDDEAELEMQRAFATALDTAPCCRAIAVRFNLTAELERLEALSAASPLAIRKNGTKH